MYLFWSSGERSRQMTQSEFTRRNPNIFWKPKATARERVEKQEKMVSPTTANGPLVYAPSLEDE